MNATTFRTYKINRTSGCSGFLCPPGHYNHTMSLEEFTGPRGRKVIGIMSLDYADNEHAAMTEGMKAAIDKIREESRKNWVASEAWIRNVYGYFRNSYAPEDGDRNLSKSITHSPAEEAVKAARKALAAAFEVEGKRYTTTIAPLSWIKEGGQGEADANSYRDGSKKPMRGARRGYEVTANVDGTQVYVYALADDGTRYGALPILQHYADALTEAGYLNVRIQEPQDTADTFVPERVTADVPNPPAWIDPNRHLAVLCIREYFPDHTPRLDLIRDPGNGYGTRECTKCGAKVQYEAKFDAHAVVTTRIIPGEGTKWTYGVECPMGGGHTIQY